MHFCYQCLMEETLKSVTEKKLISKLYKALQILGYDFTNFEYSKNQRIIFQKLVYSLQKFDVNFGYSYNLYINGPYSPGLASDGYHIAQNLEDFNPDIFKFSQKGSEKIEKVKEFIDNDSSKDWLEILCTLDYLYTHSSTYRNDTDKLKDRFRELKPHLVNESLITKALSKIKNVHRN